MTVLGSEPLLDQRLRDKKRIQARKGCEIVDAENALFLFKGSRVYHVHRIEC